MKAAEGEAEMPKFICRRCGREYWGWGVDHMFRSGKRLVCPDCEGVLVEKTERLGVQDAPDSGDEFFDGPEAA